VSRAEVSRRPIAVDRDSVRDRARAGRGRSDERRDGVAWFGKNQLDNSAKRQPGGAGEVVGVSMRHTVAADFA
jgi:hypothetical protein